MNLLHSTTQNETTAIGLMLRKSALSVRDNTAVYWICIYCRGTAWLLEYWIAAGRNCPVATDSVLRITAMPWHSLSLDASRNLRLGKRYGDWKKVASTRLEFSGFWTVWQTQRHRPAVRLFDDVHHVVEVVDSKHHHFLVSGDFRTNGTS